MRVSDSAVAPQNPMSNPHYFAGKNVSMMVFVTTLVNKLIPLLDSSKIADPVLFANYIVGMIADQSNVSKPYLSHLMDLLYNVAPATSLFVLGDLVSIREKADVSIPKVYVNEYITPLNYRVTNLDPINMTAELTAEYPNSNKTASGTVPVQVLLPSEYQEIMWPDTTAAGSIDLRKKTDELA